MLHGIINILKTLIINPIIGFCKIRRLTISLYMQFFFTRLLRVLTILILLSAIQHAANAEFLQTSNYFQTPDGYAQVIPTNLGIYFLIPDEKINVQEFNISKINKGKDAFLEFDKALNRYSALYLGSKRFEVRGSFSLKIDKLTIKIDNYANPYCTVELSPDKAEPSIIAFQGVTGVANYNGRSAVAILSANQIFENLSDIHPYILKSPDTLTLNGNEVTSNSIGLDIQIPESPCLINSDEIVFLTRSELNAIRENKDSQSRKKDLEAAIKKNKVNVLKDLILLKANKSIIALNPKDSSIKSITLVNSEPRICEIQNINLG
jgi:hypothetical protein